MFLHSQTTVWDASSNLHIMKHFLSSQDLERYTWRMFFKKILPQIKSEIPSSVDIEQISSFSPLEDLTKERYIICIWFVVTHWNWYILDY